MKAQPFMLIARARLASVEAAVGLTVRRWAADWGIAPDAVALRAQRAWECAQVAAPGAWLRADAQEAQAYAAWHPRSAAVLERLMFAPDAGLGAAGVDTAQLAPAAGRKAQDALAAAVLGALVPDAATASGACAAPDAALYARGAGAVVLSLDLGGCESVLLLDDACVRALCGPADAPALPALAAVDLQRALADTEVALDLTIGAARVGLSNLLTLAAGDVIRLGTPVEQPVTLSLPSGAVLLNGYMGRAGSQVAVDLTRSTGLF